MSLCVHQGGLDVGLPGHDGAGGQSGVVDVGGGGCLQEAQERRQDGAQRLRQEDAQSAGPAGRQGRLDVTVV